LTTATSHPDSTPFLLVRPSSGDVTDVLEQDEEDSGAKSVPPRPPPTSVRTTENTLPSVIVDLKELEATEEEEAQRSSDVDGLLDDGLLEAIEAHAHARDSRRVQTLHVIEHRQGSARRNAAILLLTACAVAGTTFAGLRAYHVSPHVLSAALHLAR
jgi:hypothetical protein